MPSARVGHIGLYRDPETLVPIEYYLKLPDDVANRMVIIVDPMLATGHSATAAVTRLKEAGATNIKFVCIITVLDPKRAMNVVTPFTIQLRPAVPLFRLAVIALNQRSAALGNQLHNLRKQAQDRNEKS